MQEGLLWLFAEYAFYTIGPPLLNLHMEPGTGMRVP